jgi:ribosomal protein S18 acetylase RimI-like enzyme
MAIEVREAAAADVETFRSLRLASLEFEPDAYLRSYSDEADLPHERWELHLSQSREDPDAGAFITERNGQAAGVMFLKADRSAETLVIKDIWVDPAHRRHGVAHAMVVAATEWGCDRSARIARLAVTVTNDAAERLFLECEFVPTGEIEPLREGSDVAVAWMERTLLS